MPQKLMFAEGDILWILPWDSSPFFTTIWGYGNLVKVIGIPNGKQIPNGNLRDILLTISPPFGDMVIW